MAARWMYAHNLPYRPARSTLDFLTLDHRIIIVCAWQAAQIELETRVSVGAT